MEAPAVEADYDPRVGEEVVRALEGLDVFISSGSCNRVSALGALRVRSIDGLTSSSP